MPVPWRAAASENQFPRMRIAYFLEDSQYPVHPPVKRALEEAAKKLAAAGLVIMPIKAFPSIEKAIDIAHDCYSLDNSKTWRKFIQDSGEPMIESLIRTKWAINKKPNYTLEDVFDMNVAWSGYKAEWQDVWTTHKLDVILCPGAETTAGAHDTYGVPAYTMVWNLLECPGVIIPVGKADRSIDKDELADPEMRRQYRADAVHGAPTSIQLIARRYQDEELIAASAVIDRILRQ